MGHKTCHLCGYEDLDGFRITMNGEESRVVVDLRMGPGPGGTVILPLCVMCLYECYLKIKNIGDDELVRGVANDIDEVMQRD